MGKNEKEFFNVFYLGMDIEQRLVLKRNAKTRDIISTWLKNGFWQKYPLVEENTT